MRRAGSWKWVVGPAAVAALLVLVGAGGAIGWRVGRLVGAWIGAGAGLLAAVLLLVVVDRFGSALAAPPDERHRS
ncbi:hypothetical protein IOD16_24260 [Saccharothrix sp. 6-C]|uniref:hypothetical protein n=1 Tax=Saccharothrix sp. 6-C TaxID=2781735 RepID=UPI00191787E7|nr:hypothetical protein [Saccharothrix sp. 6-C]QQQ74296.1 hypothetical protein IOD16_24260 [Saccharothrix sp. 6-C]